MKLIRNGLAFGHIIECFDNTLYGFFSVLLAPVFFPTTDPFTHTLSTFGAFAAGYITKPLGAIVFGLLGDSTNRNLPLVLSIGLVGVPTLIIGLLPSYQDVGILAPIVLILCRMFQGFFVGGDFAGVNVYIYETIPEKELGINTGALIASGVLGAIMATLAGMVAFHQIFPEWSWRVPFILGGFLALFAVKLRQKLELIPSDTKNQTTYMQSVRILLTTYKKEMFFCFFFAGLTTIPLNLSTVYVNKIYGDLGFSASTSMALNALTMVFNAFFLVLFGYLADRVGFNKMITRGCIANVVFAIPSFWLLTGSSVGIESAVLFVFLMMANGTMINGCAFPYMASLFPKSCRYSGLAISYTFGIALLSGTAPLIATILNHTFGTEIAVAGYLMFISGFSLFLYKTFFPQKPADTAVSYKKAA